MTLETAFDLPFWFEFAATVTGGCPGATISSVSPAKKRLRWVRYSLPSFQLSTTATTSQFRT